MAMPSITRLAAAVVVCLTCNPGAAADTPAAPAAPATRLSGVKVPPVWLKRDGKPVQPLTVSVQHSGATVEATLYVDGVESAKVELKAGNQSVEVLVAATEQARSVALRLDAAGAPLATTSLELKPPPTSTSITPRNGNAATSPWCLATSAANR